MDGPSKLPMEMQKARLKAQRLISSGAFAERPKAVCQDLLGWLLSGVLLQIPVHETLVLTRWSILHAVGCMWKDLYHASGTASPEGPACHNNVMSLLDPAGGWVGKELSVSHCRSSVLRESALLR